MDDRMLDNDVDVKRYIFIFLGFIAFVFIAILLVINGMKSGYMIIDESVVITKGLFGYEQVDDWDKKMFKESYTVSGNFGDIKDVTIDRSSSGEWTYYDKRYKDLNLSNVKFAYTNKFKKVKIADYDFEYYDSSDDSILKQVLGARKISEFSKQVRKSIFDFDGDGKKEKIYTLNSFNGSNSYGVMFMEKNGKIIRIADDDLYLIREIADIDSDGKYELIVSKGATDVISPNSFIRIYKVNGSNVKCMMNCK